METQTPRWCTRFEKAVVVAASLAGCALVLRHASLELRTDLAANAPWTASSAAADHPRQGLGFHPFEGRPNVFFWTQVEMSPWVRFDLGAPRRIRSIWVQNRLDDHYEWAIPLVAEISTDGVRWTEVGRRDETFYTWRAVFPASAARWVRLRVPRPTELHLGRVEIR